MKQRSFWDDELEADLEIKRHARREDPPTSHEAAEELIESGRVSAQCKAILDRLRIGSAPSSQLAAISLKYTSRISDLRQRGYKITCSRAGAEWWYTLESPDAD